MPPSQVPPHTMPREIVTIQVGQCGNQIGRSFWSAALHEHAENAKVSLREKHTGGGERRGFGGLEVRSMWCTKLGALVAV